MEDKDFSQYIHIPTPEEKDQHFEIPNLKSDLTIQEKLSGIKEALEYVAGPKYTAIFEEWFKDIQEQLNYTTTLEHKLQALSYMLLDYGFRDEMYLDESGEGDLYFEASGYLNTYGNPEAAHMVKELFPLKNKHLWKEQH